MICLKPLSVDGVHIMRLCAHKQRIRLIECKMLMGMCSLTAHEQMVTVVVAVGIAAADAPLHSFCPSFNFD